MEARLCDLPVFMGVQGSSSCQGNIKSVLGVVILEMDNM